LTLDQIERSFSVLVSDRCAAFTTAHDALKAQRTHQPLHGTAGDRDVLSAELSPDLAHTVDVEILLVNALNLGHQQAIALQPRWQPGRLGVASLALVVKRWGDRQLRADRLDPVSRTVGIDERHHYFGRRSSSAWAK
jgi:hypothetical protein